jgi:transposase
MDGTVLAGLIAQGISLEEIARRFGMHPSTVGYWVKKHGLEAPYRAKHAARGGLTREALEPLVAEGLSIREIADRLGVSAGTVRHWLAKHGLETQPSRRGNMRVAASAQGERVVRMTCRRHGETKFILEGRGYYRCLRCCGERVSRRRRKVKQILVEEAGGTCLLCGYERCIAALEFHHVDPSTKRFRLSHGGTISLERLRKEAGKCVLLCSNCHAEVEAGFVALPATETCRLPRKPIRGGAMGSASDC